MMGNNSNSGDYLQSGYLSEPYLVIGLYWIRCG